MEITIYPHPANQPFINLEAHSSEPSEMVEFFTLLPLPRARLCFFQQEGWYKAVFYHLPDEWAKQANVAAYTAKSNSPIAGEDTIEISWLDWQEDDVVLQVTSPSPEKIVQFLMILQSAVNITCVKQESFYDLVCAIDLCSYQEVETQLLAFSQQDSF